MSGDRTGAPIAIDSSRSYRDEPWRIQSSRGDVLCRYLVAGRAVVISCAGGFIRREETPWHDLRRESSRLD